MRSIVISALAGFAALTAAAAAPAQSFTIDAHGDHMGAVAIGAAARASNRTGTADAGPRIYNLGVCAEVVGDFERATQLCARADSSTRARTRF